MMDAEQQVEQVPQEVTLDEKQIVVVRTHTHSINAGNRWIRIYGLSHSTILEMNTNSLGFLPTAPRRHRDRCFLPVRGRGSHYG
jgi:hypothetical protein